MNFTVKAIPYGMAQANTYTVVKDGRAVIIDASAPPPLEAEALLITHGHFDHTECAHKYGCPVYMDSADVGLKVFGHKAKDFEIAHSPQDGEIFNIAGFNITAISIPGHTKGGICYYFKDQKIIFTGDTLFEGSVGRTDLPGGSHSELIAAIRAKIFTLPDDTTVYPGHGDKTTIGAEKKSNPFF